MKKPYQSPTLLVECYALDESIASNCAWVIKFGPADEAGGKAACDGYVDFQSVKPGLDVNAPPYNVTFYENTCDCYYSFGEEGYWTS